MSCLYYEGFFSLKYKSIQGGGEWLNSCGDFVFALDGGRPLYEPAATGGSDGADPGLELPAEARGAGVGVHVAPDLHRRLARRPVRRPLRRAALGHDCKEKDM